MALQTPGCKHYKKACQHCKLCFALLCFALLWALDVASNRVDATDEMIFQELTTQIDWIACKHLLSPNITCNMIIQSAMRLVFNLSDITE